MPAPPELLQLQQAFAAAVIAEPGAAPVVLPIADDAPGAAARFAIYRHHLRLSLIEALAANFPVTLALVGEPFFRQVARRFVITAPPAEPRLHAFGADFPAFLGEVADLAAYAFVPDVARLEWALVRAATAEDEPRPIVALPLTPATRLRLIAGCSIVTSPWPIDAIWRAHQGGDDPEPVDLAAGGVRLLVHRHGDETGWTALSEADVRFVAALAGLGASLGEAVATARLLMPGYDAIPLLAALTAAGLTITAPGQPAATHAEGRA